MGGSVGGLGPARRGAGQGQAEAGGLEVQFVVGERVEEREDFLDILGGQFHRRVVSNIAST